MEVLEECINEDWENHKDEFLEICIDEFAKKDYTTYPDLKDDDLIIENVKCISDIKKQNILWNKWIQKHRNLSQNLKKDDWFNNLKDEWKREVAYIQEMEEIKKKSSNENQKVSFLEREKDIWRQWISKKGMIIQQYFYQYWNNGLAEELQNMSDECTKEDTKNYVSLLNVEEMQHKENYEELCKYIKKKLLTKFCILVLITVLEECKKEVNLENRESYLDRSINEWKGEGYSSKKQEITEMEVLEECINEDWENHKDEFLEICIDEFAKKDYTTYPDLKDDDLIIENVKCISDIKKQNILWNKWIQKHRNLSQNLKKDDWFNNLKDEWKREVAYIQEMEEIKKKSSNENQKVSFLEREKDIWRQWISKKGMIIQQYFYQYWNNGLAEELQNMSDECTKEDTKNYKNEEITENIIEYNNNDIENKRNEEFDAHIWKDSFRNEIEDWIREDDLYANSIVSDRTVDKSDEIEEKQFL
ncbi:STP1 protein [Plasmodium malariae]|uniref:STP1 protein n=1 Tax=Plasmodium malariae TaxID=5858 RepID=A0A1A8WMM1_PLAMA|nr:STP1 protein [Plasmodium malariae]